MIMGSVLLYHNGNQRIVEFFRKHLFCYHKFAGNWSDRCNDPSDYNLYEICISDATDQNLQLARTLGIRIIRYITSYEDDMMYCLPELARQDYQQWLTNVVCKNLCFADIIDSDFFISDVPISDRGIIITTGRTANTHLQMIDKSVKLVECSKIIDHTLLSAQHAILLWRLDQWQCLTSSWILQFYDQAIHQFKGKVSGSIKSTEAISTSWIDRDWKNLCLFVLDSALFFRYIIRRPVYHMTTEYITNMFQSDSEKVQYSKKDLIPNFHDMERYYDNSQTQKLVTECYNNALKHVI